MQINKLKSKVNALNEVFSKYKKNHWYLYAKMLYKINNQIYDELLNCNLSDESRKSIILHYTLWFTEFEQLEKQLKPSLKDKFVFFSLDEDYKYPKSIIQSLCTE